MGKDKFKDVYFDDSKYQEEKSYQVVRLKFDSNSIIEVPNREDEDVKRR